MRIAKYAKESQAHASGAMITFPNSSFSEHGGDSITNPNSISNLLYYLLVLAVTLPIGTMSLSW